MSRWGACAATAADVSLRPKSFALLHYLVTHAGRLVTKDELLSKIWPRRDRHGRIRSRRCVSESAGPALEDTGQTMIKTVVETGLCLWPDLSHCWTSARFPAAAGSRGRPKQKSAARRTGWMLPLLGLAAVLAMAGAVWSTAFWRPAALPPRLFADRSAVFRI